MGRGAQHTNHIVTRSRQTALILCAAFAAFYWLTTSGLPPNSDGWLIARVAARLGHGQAPVFEKPVHLMVLPGRPAPDGSPGFYSKYPLGQSLLEIPFVLVGGITPDGDPTITPGPRMLLYALPALMGAATVALFFLFLHALGVAHRSAVFAGALVGLATMVWPYARTLYTEGTQAALLLAGVYCLTRFRATQHTAAPWAWLAGSALGMLILVRPPAILYVPVLAAYALWALPREHRRPVLLGLGVPCSIAVLMTLGYNVYRFGEVFAFGYSSGRDGFFGFSIAHFPDGLYGLLASPGKGVIWYCPLLLVAAWAWPRLWRTHRPLAVTSIVLFLITLVFHAGWWAWHGDWSWGPRFLVPILPLLLLPLGIALEGARAGPRLSRAVVGLVAAVSLSVQLLGNAFPYPAYNAFLLQHVFPDPFASGQPVRDDMAPAHFSWAFSPLSGNVWFLRMKLLGADPLSTCPWRHTTVTVPDVPREAIPIDIWVWRFQHEAATRMH